MDSEDCQEEFCTMCEEELDDPKYSDHICDKCFYSFIDNND